jgi:DNA recombination protein RmuC
MAGHWSGMGDGLKRAIDAYNSAVGSLESRVLPTARKFRELEVGDDARELEAPAPLEQLPREVQAEDMRGPHELGADPDPERH